MRSHMFVSQLSYYNYIVTFAMESLPVELLNVIADLLDTPSLVIFRMLNISIRNLVYMKGPHRPKQWRGQFFELQCMLEKHYNLIEYANQCGLKIKHYNTNSEYSSFGKKISGIEILQPINVNNLLDIELEIANNISNSYFIKSFFRKYYISDNIVNPLLNILLKYKEPTKLFNELMEIYKIGISFQTIKMLDNILTPDWKMVCLRFEPSQIYIIQFVASKGRKDLLNIIDIWAAISMNLTELQWKWLLDNNLVSFHGPFVSNLLENHEFPTQENIGDNIKHLLCLNIPVQHFIIKRLINTGETDVLEKLLINRYGNITSEMINSWLLHIEKTKETFPPNRPFDNTLYRETVEILNKHLDLHNIEYDD